MCWGISERGGVDGDDEESRAAHSSQKCLSIAEAGLSDVWRTDCGRLNQETPWTVHVAMCAALKSTYRTAIRLFG